MKMILKVLKTPIPPALTYVSIMTLFAAISISVLTSCSTFGRNPTPPSALESSLFHVTTNYVPVVIPAYTTNVIQVTQTNTLQVTQTLTNYQGTTVTNYFTNTVPVLVTNTVPVLVPGSTNLQAQYNYGPGGTLSGAQGIVSAIPIYGTLASTALGLLAGVWGWMRSTKNRQTAANTMQVVETMRQFIQALPNGHTYDAALVQWMQAHQADANVLNNVLALLASEVSNTDAQFAANSVIATINGLSATPPIPVPPVKAA